MTASITPEQARERSRLLRAYGRAMRQARRNLGKLRSGFDRPGTGDPAHTISSSERDRLENQINTLRCCVSEADETARVMRGIAETYRRLSLLRLQRLADSRRELAWWRGAAWACLGVAAALSIMVACLIGGAL